MRIGKVLISSMVGFALFVIVIARMTSNAPAPAEERLEVPARYAGVYRMRTDLLQRYWEVRNELVLVKHQTLRDIVLPGLQEYNTALARLEPRTNDPLEKEIHARLMSDATQLRNALTNLKNAYITDSIASSVDRLTAIRNSAVRAVQGSDEVWLTVWDTKL